LQLRNAQNTRKLKQKHFVYFVVYHIRLQLAAEQDIQKAGSQLDRMETILRVEIVRTERSLVATTRDSRLGFLLEQDYVYAPYSLREKLRSLHETLENQLARRHKETTASRNY
jgi:hypothetical protein